MLIISIMLTRYPEKTLPHHAYYFHHAYETSGKNPTRHTYCFHLPLNMRHSCLDRITLNFVSRL